MRDFGEKEKHARARPTRLARSNLAGLVPRSLHPTLQLQRTIGNRAVQQILRTRCPLPGVASGAHADRRVVDGDFLTDLRVMSDPQRHLKVNMKDGVLDKNELG